MTNAELEEKLAAALKERDEWRASAEAQPEVDRIMYRDYQRRVDELWDVLREVLATTHAPDPTDSQRRYVAPQMGQRFSHAICDAERILANR